MNGLIIAFSFSPNKNVGALRPTYWAEEMKNNHGFNIDVITAVHSERQNENYNRIVVPNKGKSFWSFLIKDEGLTWKKDLIQYFNTIQVEKYDFVIFTGGPFFHFSLSKFFKKKGVKVILDYRDPFSYNPRFRDKGIKKIVKEQIEKRFLKFADIVATVNNACHDYIGTGLKLNRLILPNGFDERIIPKQKQDDLSYDLFYAGRYYWEPVDFLEVLSESNYSIAHAGQQHSYSHPFFENGRMHELGLLTQKEMYIELNKAEIGVIFTIDVAFESTTKLYDYLALNKKILIITKGEPNQGVLNRELENYPNYRWVKNNKKDILKAIQELKEMELIECDVNQFSRKKSLELLSKEIKELFNKESSK